MKVRLLLCVGSLIVLGGVDSTAQARQVPRAGVQRAEVTPCVGRPDSIECANYRIKQLEHRLAGSEEMIRVLQSSQAARLSGPPVKDLQMPDEKADATTDYLNKRIDALQTTVKDLVKKVNGQ